MARKSHLQTLADNVATRWLTSKAHIGLREPASVRDYCDSLTGSELDCIPLDILTDMVETRLEGEHRDRLLAAYHRRHGH